jgi:hypothetical protein
MVVAAQPVMRRVFSPSVRRVHAASWTSRRSLATGAPKDFSQKLAAGPILDDFISGDVDPSGSDRLLLGNTSACVLLYEDWGLE